MSRIGAILKGAQAGGLISGKIRATREGVHRMQMEDKASFMDEQQLAMDKAREKIGNQLLKQQAQQNQDQLNWQRDFRRAMMGA